MAHEGARGARKYAATARGRGELGAMREQVERMKEHHAAMGGLMLDVFGGKKKAVYEQLMRIKELAEAKGTGRQERRVRGALARCVEELAGI